MNAGSGTRIHYYDLSRLASSSPTLVTMPTTRALPIKKALFESETPSRRV